MYINYTSEFKAFQGRVWRMYTLWQWPRATDHQHIHVVEFKNPQLQSILIMLVCSLNGACSGLSQLQKLLITGKVQNDNLYILYQNLWWVFFNFWLYSLVCKRHCSDCTILMTKMASIKPALAAAMPVKGEQGCGH